MRERCLGRNALEDIVDEGVEDGHCLGATGVSGDTFQRYDEPIVSAKHWRTLTKQQQKACTLIDLQRISLHSRLLALLLLPIGRLLASCSLGGGSGSSDGVQDFGHGGRRFGGYLRSIRRTPGCGGVEVFPYVGAPMCRGGGGGRRMFAS